MISERRVHKTDSLRKKSKHDQNYAQTISISVSCKLRKNPRIFRNGIMIESQNNSLISMYSLYDNDINLTDYLSSKTCNTLYKWTWKV